jgi:hypothetical protein
MFLDHHPDTPGKKTALKHLGYWHAVKLDPKTGDVLGTGMSYDHYEERGGLPLPRSLPGSIMGGSGQR